MSIINFTKSKIIENTLSIANPKQLSLYVLDIFYAILLESSNVDFLKLTSHQHQLLRVLTFTHGTTHQSLILGQVIKLYKSTPFNLIFIIYTLEVFSKKEF